MLIDEQVQTKWNVELLIVDPFFKGKARSVVNVEFRLCGFEEGTNLLIKTIKRLNEIDVSVR